MDAFGTSAATLDLGTGREMAAIAYYDRCGRLIALRHVTGGIDAVRLPLARIVRDALALDAASLLLAHAHPSGDPAPSAADLALTRQLARLLHPLGIDLVDHVIVGGGVTSLRADGVL